MKEKIDALLLEVKELRDGAFKAQNQAAYDELGRAMRMLINARNALV
jgi:hypothetical protein